MIDSIVEKYVYEAKTLKAGIDITRNKKSLASAFGELSAEIGKTKEKNIEVIKKKALDILNSEEYNISDETRFKNKQILKTKKDYFSLLAWISNVYLKGSGNASIDKFKK